MESTDKLTDTNAILAYLYETFPLCFIAEGFKIWLKGWLMILKSVKLNCELP